MYTMNRCLPLPTLVPRPLRALLGACALLVLLASPPAALAQTQVPAGLGGTRNFPDAAVRGQLTVNSATNMALNGTTVRVAPGMRIFSPQNTLVMAHTVAGQTFTVNYLIEHSTGMLLTAWILTKGEAEQPRKGSDATSVNFTTDPNTTSK